MSADFSKILVKDDRLEVVDNIKYAVIKGGQNVTAARFGAISKSDSQVVFNIQVPSEQTLIDRRVMFEADIAIDVRSSVYTVTKSATTASPPVAAVYAKIASPTGCGYGQYAALAPYPLHQLMTVASATINNNTVSINIRDVLPAIQRLLEERELSSYNGMTPNSTDPFYSYTSAISSVNNPNAGQYNSVDPDFNTRGSMYLKSYSSAVDGVECVESFIFHLSEPLMISPFIYSNPKCNNQAFYGIQNMNVVLNIGTLDRVFRGLSGVNNISLTGAASAGTVYPSPAGIFGVTDTVTNASAQSSLPSINSVKAATNGLFSDTPYLRFMFLTPHPSDLMPARNIVPFYELPRYISPAPFQDSINAVNYSPLTGDGGTVLKLADGKVAYSQTLQLNQIPDKLILFVEKNTKSVGDSDSYLPIQKININFNNNSGILASAACEDLYRMSKDNGSNQTWPQWLGLSTSLQSPTALAGAAVGGNASVTGLYLTGMGAACAQAAQNKFITLPTCGSLLVLEFGHDIQLVEDFFAPGSLGNFNIQVQLTVSNQTEKAAVPADYRMVMITMNSGVFVCERGTSSTYTGILTRADVLEASEQDAYTRSDVQRMVGGSFHDLLKSGVSKLAPLAKAAAPHIMPHVEKYVKGKLGLGHSGGGGSGGALHGRYH